MVKYFHKSFLEGKHLIEAQADFDEDLNQSHFTGEEDTLIKFSLDNLPIFPVFRPNCGKY